MLVTLAPVLLFTYKRLQVLEKTVAALQANHLAKETELFIFSDGSKNDLDKEEVAQVRAFIKTISGFKNIHLFESPENKGLANSIINGVSKVIWDYEKVIVLEDDLATSTNFLAFMNQCLKQYEHEANVFSISGYTPPVKAVAGYDFDAYFFSRNSSHGWATWKNRWLQVDWAVSDYRSFITNRTQRAAFNKGGSDLSGMLKKQMEGKINSWSIRFCYQQFKTNTVTVYPAISKVQNLGFGKDATHTKNYNRFHTTLDNSNKLEFGLPTDVVCKKELIKSFQSFHSLTARGVGKLKTYLQAMGLLKNV